MSHNQKVICLIVTFNGEKSISETLNALFQQTRVPDACLIIDNASTDQSLKIIRQMQVSNLKIISSNKNKGVAAAYNLALKEALNNNFNRLWILDQDSICDSGCLKALLRAADKSVENTGAFFPNAVSKMNPDIKYPPYVWKGKGFENITKQQLNGNKLSEVDSSISSGALYNVDALQNAGGFREDFFIDFVDHEVHMRLRKTGYKLSWVPEAVLYHEIGIPQKTKSGDTHFIHPVWRYYYMGRNMTVGYWKLGGYKAVLEFWRMAGLRAKQLKAAGIYQKGMMFNFRRGVMDALLGRMGHRL